MTTYKRKKRTQQGSVARKMIAGIGVGLALFLFFVCIAALILSLTNIQFDYLKYILYIILPFSVLCASVLNGYRCTDLKGIVVGILTGVITVIILTAVIVAVNKAKIDPSCIFIFPLSAVIGIPGGILGANLR